MLRLIVASGWVFYLEVILSSALNQKSGRGKGQNYSAKDGKHADY
jgi:hypothetical protein